jgi:hypothetical protein
MSTSVVAGGATERGDVLADAVLEGVPGVAAAVEDVLMQLIAVVGIGEACERRAERRMQGAGGSERWTDVEHLRLCTYMAKLACHSCTSFVILAQTVLFQ